MEKKGKEQPPNPPLVRGTNEQSECLKIHVLNAWEGDNILIEFGDGVWGIVDSNRQSKDAPIPALEFLKKEKQRGNFKNACCPHAPSLGPLQGNARNFRSLQRANRRVLGLWKRCAPNYRLFS